MTKLERIELTYDLMKLCTIDQVDQSKIDTVVAQAHEVVLMELEAECIDYDEYTVSESQGILDLICESRSIHNLDDKDQARKLIISYLDALGRNQGGFTADIYYNWHHAITEYLLNDGISYYILPFIDYEAMKLLLQDQGYEIFGNLVYKLIK